MWLFEAESHNCKMIVENDFYFWLTNFLTVTEISCGKFMLHDLSQFYHLSILTWVSYSFWDKVNQKVSQKFGKKNHKFFQTIKNVEGRFELIHTNRKLPIDSNRPCVHYRFQIKHSKIFQVEIRVRNQSLLQKRL